MSSNVGGSAQAGDVDDMAKPASNTSTSSPEVNRKPITRWNKLIYAAPAFALACASIFHSTFQTKYYVDDLGWLVDNTYVKGNPLIQGRRKPFLILMAPIVAASFFMMYATPSVSTSGLQWWYIIVAVIYNAVPLTLAYYSLGTEITSDYDEQSSVFGWVHVMSCLGMIVGSMVPGLLTLNTQEDSQAPINTSTDAPNNINQVNSSNHTLIFPLFAFAIAISISFTFILLAARTKTAALHSGKRHDDGGLWEQLVQLGSTATTAAKSIVAGAAIPMQRGENASREDPIEPEEQVCCSCNACIIHLGRRRQRRIARARASAEEKKVAKGVDHDAGEAVDAAEALEDPNVEAVSDTEQAHTPLMSFNNDSSTIRRRVQAPVGSTDMGEVVMEENDNSAGKAKPWSLGRMLQNIRIQSAWTQCACRCRPVVDMRHRTRCLGLDSVDWTVVTWPKDWHRYVHTGIVRPQPSQRPATVELVEDLESSDHPQNAFDFLPPAAASATSSGAGCTGRLWKWMCCLRPTRKANSLTPVLVVSVDALYRSMGDDGPLIASNLVGTNAWAVASPWRGPGKSLESTPIDVEASEHEANKLHDEVSKLLIRQADNQAKGSRMDEPIPMVAGTAWAARNVPFRVLLVMIMFLSLAAVLARTMLAFYVEYVLQPKNTELWLGMLLSAELIAAVVATPVWLFISRKLDQKITFLLAGLLAMPIALIAFFRFGAGDVIPFMVCATWAGLTEGGASFLIRSARSSIIDYDYLYLGVRREAQYLTYLAIVAHWVDIPAAGVGLIMLASSGYARNTSVQNPQVIFLLRVFTLLIPLLFSLLAWFTMWMFPITRDVHTQLFGRKSVVVRQPGMADQAHDTAPEAAGFNNNSDAFGQWAPMTSTCATCGSNASPDPETSRLCQCAGPTPASPTEDMHALEADGSPSESYNPHSSHFRFDPISEGRIFPSEVYASASLRWVLDHFSSGSLRQVLEARMEGAQAAIPDESFSLHSQNHDVDSPIDSKCDDVGVNVAVGVGGPFPLTGNTAHAVRKLPSRTICCCFRPRRLPISTPITSANTVVLCGKGAKASLPCLPDCLPTRWFVSLVGREIGLTCFWAVCSCIAIWLIAVGASPEYENLAWMAMLLLGFAGLLTIFHGLRIYAAFIVEDISSANIRRYLRLHYK